MSNLTNPRGIPTPRDTKENELLADEQLHAVVAFEGPDAVYVRYIAAKKNMGIAAYMRWCVIEQTKVERKNRGH